jgi:hypothetical protein
MKIALLQLGCRWGAITKHKDGYWVVGKGEAVS